MKLITTLVCALFFFVSLHAQGFDKTLNDSVRIMSIVPTKDGGAVILGNNLYLVRGAPDRVVVMKVNAQEEREWRTDTKGIPLVHDLFFSPNVGIAEDIDGNY